MYSRGFNPSHRLGPEAGEIMAEGVYGFQGLPPPVICFLQ